MDWEEAITEGIKARQSRDNSQWKLGDLACALETAYAGRTLAKYAKEIGVEYSTLQEYRRVSAGFEKSSRLDNLTWSHHQAATAWNNPNQWLNHAVKHRWSVATMKDEQAKAVQRATTAMAQSAIENGEAPLPASIPAPPQTQVGAGSLGNWVKKVAPEPATSPAVDEFVSRVSKDFQGQPADEHPRVQEEPVRPAGHEDKVLKFRDAIIAIYEYSKEDEATLNLWLEAAVELDDEPLTQTHILGLYDLLGVLGF